MCQIIPCKVLRVFDGRVEILFSDGPRMVSLVGIPELAAGDFVAVHAGAVLKRIPADEAEAILALYRELDEMMQLEELAEAGV